MGKQTGFYAADEDFALLMELAEDVGLVAIPRYIETDSRVTAVLPTKFEAPQPPLQFYFLPAELSTAEAFYTIPIDQDESMLDYFASPVIECAASDRIDARIFNGRIYLGTDRDDPLLYPIVDRKYAALAVLRS